MNEYLTSEIAVTDQSTHPLIATNPLQGLIYKATICYKKIQRKTYEELISPVIMPMEIDIMPSGSGRVAVLICPGTDLLHLLTPKERRSGISDVGVRVFTRC